MSNAATSFKVHAPKGHQRYLRDLFYRMARDEELTTKANGDEQFVIAVYTEKEYREMMK